MDVQLREGFHSHELSSQGFYFLCHICGLGCLRLQEAFYSPCVDLVHHQESSSTLCISPSSELSCDPNVDPTPVFLLSLITVSSHGLSNSLRHFLSQFTRLIKPIMKQFFII